MTESCYAPCIAPRWPEIWHVMALGAWGGVLSPHWTASIHRGVTSINCQYIICMKANFHKAALYTDEWIALRNAVASIKGHEHKEEAAAAAAAAPAPSVTPNAAPVIAGTAAKFAAAAATATAAAAAEVAAAIDAATAQEMYQTAVQQYEDAQASLDTMAGSNASSQSVAMPGLPDS
jgi:predicted lipid-binding transport protein (Tim44 family)